MRRILAGTVLAASLLALPGLLASAAAPAAWSPPQVLLGADTISADLAAAPGGGVVVAAGSAGGGQGDGIRVGTPVPDDRVVARRVAPSLALASHGGHLDTRIAWSDGDALWVTRNDTGAWVSSRLWVGRSRLHAAATRGRGLVVAFADRARRVRALTWDPVSGPTSPATIATLCGSCSVRDLAVAAGSGEVWITWVEQRYSPTWGRTLHAARRTAGGGWRTWTVSRHDDYGGDVALDGRGRPLIVHGHLDADHEYPAGIWLTRRTASGWSTRRVFGPTGGTPVIATDADGRVVAAVSSQAFDGGCQETPGPILVRRLDIADTARTVPGSRVAGHCRVGLDAALDGGRVVLLEVLHDGTGADDPAEVLRLIEQS